MTWYKQLNNGVVGSGFTGYEDYYDDPNFTWDDLRYALTLKYGQAFSGGWDRLVFKTKYGVVKLAYPNHEGMNYREEFNYQITRQNKEFIKIARCRIVFVKGFPLLLMEWVKPYWEVGLSYKDLPEWCGYIDGSQVGYNRKGELVAFDAA